MRFGRLNEPSPDDEIDAEISQHVELLTARYIAEGLSPADARAKALARFGDVDAVRAELKPLAHHLDRRRRMREYFIELRQDLAFAFRSFARAPLFAVVAIVTLAIGIGANTAVFSVAHAVLLRPLPYANADRAVVIWNSYPGSGMMEAAVAPAELAEMGEQLTTVDGLVALRPQAVALTGDCAGASTCDPLQANSYAVTPTLFSLLGVSPARGRSFTAADGAPDAPPVAMLSHALWQSRFGGDPNIVGRTVTAGGVVRTVVGVMPPGVRFPDVPLGYLHEPADLWTPMEWTLNRGEERGNQYLAVLAIRRADAAPEAFRAELDLIESRFKAAFSDRYTGPAAWRIADIPLRTQLTGDLKPALALFSGAVALVLLIACANVANLVLARGAVRRTEFVVRAALGAGGGRIMRQVLAESLALGALGGVGGVLIALVTVKALPLLAPADLPYVSAARLDGVVLLFALGISLLASTICGLLPALQQSRTDLASTIRAGGRGTGGSVQGRRVRRALVVGEVALTLVVLVGAALLAGTFRALQSERVSFTPEGVLTFEVTLAPSGYVDGNAVIAFDEALQARLLETPGVRAATAVYPLPLSGDQWSGTFNVEGLVLDGQPEPNAQYHRVSPGYFSTMEIALLSGREFTADDRRGAPDVVIVNDELAQRYWPGENPIGKRVNIVGQELGTYSEVIGVAPTVKGAAAESRPQIYMPMLQRPQRLQRWAVRTDGDALAIAEGVRAAVRALDPSLPLAKLVPMTDLQARAVAPQRFNATLLTSLGIVALVLAATGLYGVVAYLVIQRTHELAVRLALGSRPAQILALVLRDGLAMALTGIAIGIGAAWGLSRLTSGLLYGLTATDPRVYAVVSLLLASVLVVASWVPARRATRIEPAELLRGQ